MGKRKSGDNKAEARKQKVAKVEEVEDVAAEKPSTINSFKNKEKVLVVSARGITFRSVFCTLDDLFVLYECRI